MRAVVLRAAAVLFAAAMVFCFVLSLSFVSLSVKAVNTDRCYLRGDANGDGRVSIIDVTAIQRHLAQYDSLSGANLPAADVDGNGLDIADATAIQRYLAEYPDPYNINEWIRSSATETTVWIKPSGNELPFLPEG